MTPDNGLKGNLIFLGVNHSSTQSVWLSLTNAAGSFKLEGPGQQLIDEWSKDQRGLRLSLSPIVSQGNGGTHHLLNSANNKKLDSENQNEGIVFPPFPSEPPGTPTHPIVIPPSSPGTPTHPIVIPPSSPGTPTHPIVIPPGSPGTPTHPIVIPPGSPGTPTHPIVTPPGSPGTPTHPIVTPPGSPGTPTHPIVLPPSSGHEGNRPISGDPTQAPPASSQLSQQSQNIKNPNQTVPITPARQLDEDKTWNIWSDNYYFGIRDGRNFVNTKGGAANFTLGADRRIINGLVGGFSLSSVCLDTTAFSGGLENNVRGFKFGPYLGYQIANQWAVDASVNYGQLQNQNKILNLNSRYVTKLVSAVLHATGLYQFGHFQIRPQPLISYTYYRNPTYDFNGTIINRPVQITRKAENFAQGLAEFKMEANYSKETKKGDLIQPFTELGVDYAFVRPSNDQVYSGNLALGSIPKVSGLFTLGLRAIHAKKLLIQASGSYLSVGQKSYNLWDTRLLVSYSFS